MSLQVWLPLNGNLKNQGLSNLTFTNNTSNIAISNVGKTGKCYTRATVKTNGRIISNENILLDGDLSMCCWAKVTATVGDTANGLVSNHNASTSKGFGITVKQVSTSDYRISCSTGNGSSRTYYTYYGTTNIKGAWHHLALTYSNTKKEFQLWVDGQVEKTQTYTNSAAASKISLFNWNLASDAANYHPACSLNDVRIYDHCLSAKEIEEIAKGLVLHYPFDNGGGNPNMVLKTHYQHAPWIGATRSWQIYEGEYCVLVNPATLYNQTNKGTSSIFPGQTFKENTQYTISLDARDDYRTDGKGTGFRIGFFYTDGTGQNFNIGSPQTWEHKVYTSAAGKTVSYIRCSYGNSGYTYIANLKVEEGSKETDFGFTDTETIYDVSGYKHNGILSSSIDFNINVPRYTLGSYFGVYNTPNMVLEDPSFLASLNNCTVCWWGKYDTTKTLLLTGQNLQTYLAASDNNAFYHSQAGIPSMYKNGILGYEYKCIPGSWDFYVLKNVDFSSWTEMKINSYANSWDLKGYLCDFRIYATELTDEQILELYQTSASIDNKGNIYAREYIENNNLNVTKTGLFQCNEIYDDDDLTIASILKNTKQIQGNTIYEY